MSPMMRSKRCVLISAQLIRIVIISDQTHTNSPKCTNLSAELKAPACVHPTRHSLDLMLNNKQAMRHVLHTTASIKHLSPKALSGRSRNRIPGTDQPPKSYSMNRTDNDLVPPAASHARTVSDRHLWADSIRHSLIVAMCPSHDMTNAK